MNEMTNAAKILNAARLTGGMFLTIGAILFCFGFFDAGSRLLTPIGIGTIIGAVFIFLIGVFFAATEEMLKRSSVQEE